MSRVFHLKKDKACFPVKIFDRDEFYNFVTQRSMFREWPSKVQNQLFNILSIIQHIRPKLESIALSYPTEEQVGINLVCFSKNFP